MPGGTIAKLRGAEPVNIVTTGPSMAYKGPRRSALESAEVLVAGDCRGERDEGSRAGFDELEPGHLAAHAAAAGRRGRWCSGLDAASGHHARQPSFGCGNPCSRAEAEAASGEPNTRTGTGQTDSMTGPMQAAKLSTSA
jgi:hypothetical protein